MKKYPEFPKLIQQSEYASATRINFMFPWLPFGSPVKSRQLKKLTRDILEKYVTEKIESGNLEGSDILSVRLREFNNETWSINFW